MGESISEYSIFNARTNWSYSWLWHATGACLPYIDHRHRHQTNRIALHHRFKVLLAPTRRAWSTPKSCRRIGLYNTLKVTQLKIGVGQHLVLAQECCICGCIHIDSKDWWWRVWSSTSCVVLSWLTRSVCNLNAHSKQLARGRREVLGLVQVNLWIIQTLALQRGVLGFAHFFNLHLQRRQVNIV